MRWHINYVHTLGGAGNINSEYDKGEYLILRLL